MVDVFLSILCWLFFKIFWHNHYNYMQYLLWILGMNPAQY